jgi:RimJ/RimL family protein N-acetyltransferase
MNLQPTLTNHLLILRPLAQKDFEGLYAVAKDPLIWAQHPCKDRYKKEVYSDFFIDSIASKGAFVIIEKSSQKIIGSTRFKKINHLENAIEIGWSFLSRDKWGGLYNKSMKKLLIDYAFEHLDYIIFYIAKDNIRSQKAVEKLGGKRVIEPHLQHFIKKDSLNWTYLISKEDWI